MTTTNKKKNVCFLENSNSVIVKYHCLKRNKRKSNQNCFWHNSQYPYPPQGWSWEIPIGSGVWQKPKFLRESISRTGNSRGWEGLNQKAILRGCMGIFWTHTLVSAIHCMKTWNLRKGQRTIQGNQILEDLISNLCKYKLNKERLTVRFG